MSVVDDFVMELERKESDSDMHFSTYYIPEYYQDDLEEIKNV